MLTNSVAAASAEFLSLLLLNDFWPWLWSILNDRHATSILNYWHTNKHT